MAITIKRKTMTVRTVKKSPSAAPATTTPIPENIDEPAEPAAAAGPVSVAVSGTRTPSYTAYAILALVAMLALIALLAIQSAENSFYVDAIPQNTAVSIPGAP